MGFLSLFLSALRFSPSSYHSAIAAYSRQRLSQCVYLTWHQDASTNTVELPFPEDCLREMRVVKQLTCMAVTMEIQKQNTYFCSVRKRKGRPSYNISHLSQEQPRLRNDYTDWDFSWFSCALLEECLNKPNKKTKEWFPCAQLPHRNGACRELKAFDEDEWSASRSAVLLLGKETSITIRLEVGCALVLVWTWWWQKLPLLGIEPSHFRWQFISFMCSDELYKVKSGIKLKTLLCWH